MLHMAVIGCADVAPPHGAEASRDGNVMTIRCNSTGETWFLSCTGSRWTGTSGNCSTHQPFTDSKRRVLSFFWVLSSNKEVRWYSYFLCPVICHYFNSMILFFVFITCSLSSIHTCPRPSSWHISLNFFINSGKAFVQLNPPNTSPTYVSCCFTMLRYDTIQ